MRSRLSLKKFLLILLVFLLFIIFPLILNRSKPSASKSQEPVLSKTSFIEKIAPAAQKVARGYGVRPSIIIGQAALETEYGTSLLADKYHNLFSQKAKANQEKIVLMKSTYSKGKWIENPETFAVYSSWEDSIYDYMYSLKKGEFLDEELYVKLATSKGYKTPAKKLQEYYYSSDPNYAQKLIEIIEENQLTSYDE